MAKKSRKQSSSDQAPQVATIEQPQIEQPKPQRFRARDCCLCQAIRPAGYWSKVTGTKGRIRHCKCTFCGNDWKQEAPESE